MIKAVVGMATDVLIEVVMSWQWTCKAGLVKLDKESKLATISNALVTILYRGSRGCTVHPSWEAD